MLRRSLLWTLLGGTAVSLLPMGAMAETAAEYPSKPVTIIVPFAAGGNTDLTQFVNNISNLLTGRLGQAIAVVAIGVTGVMAALGAASMRAFGGVLLGVGVLFSAGWLVSQLTGGA